MWAILSLASAHLFNTKSPAIQISAFEAGEYYSRCIKLLHPMLREKAFDGDVFAATIIMRVWEEIHGKLQAESFSRLIMSNPLLLSSGQPEGRP
jgi:hypothetical protein